MLQLVFHTIVSIRLLSVIVLYCITGLYSCSSQTYIPKTQITTSQKLDNNLIFFDVTLEQADKVGQPIWSFKTKRAVYTKNKQFGRVDNLYGEIYQDGQVVYQIQSDAADIKQDDKRLFLRGKITAINPKNGAVLRGNELEWKPQKDLLIIRKEINGTHKQLKAIAKEARIKTRSQRIDFSGDVVIDSINPPLKIRTQHLTWQIMQDKLITSHTIKIDHFKNRQIAEHLRGSAAEVDLKAKIARITKNAQIHLLEPLMEITSKEMTWDINTHTVSSNTSVQVFQKSENIKVTGNYGELKIPQKILSLGGGVYVTGQHIKFIKSQKLTWLLDKNSIEASGDVVYKQVKPSLTFNGDKAVGNLKIGQMVISGGNNRKSVVAEIIPQ